MNLISSSDHHKCNLYFTLDIDWAIEPVIDYALSFFRENKIKCTVFCTHSSEILKNLESDLFEVAIHPNFNESLIYGKGDSSQRILDKLLNIFPESKGVRSHSMTSSTKLLYQFKDLGLAYDSNIFFPYNWSISPFLCFSGITRIPYNWEDDVHFLYNKGFDYQINYNSDNFYVLDFHPIHIYLNSINRSHYHEAKKHYDDINMLKSYINSHQIGVKDFLDKLIKKIKINKMETGFLKDLL